MLICAPTVTCTVHPLGTGRYKTALGVCANEAGTPLKEGVLTASPPRVEEIGQDASSREVYALAPPPKPISFRRSRRQLPDQVLLSTYVLPLEKVLPSTGMVALGLEVLRF